MSTEPTIDVTVEEQSLDDFATELFGESKEPVEPAKAEVEEDDASEDNDAPNKDTHSAEDGASEEEEVEETEDSDEPSTDEDDDKGKKPNRLQERINEITAARRTAERRAEEAERREQELLRKLNEKQPETKPTPKVEEKTTTTNEGPSAADKNEDGTDKYPLGEFDPKFVRDTIQHALNEQAQQMEAKRVEDAKLSEQEQYRNGLQASWNDKLEDAQERYPDYQEKGEAMLSVFESIDPAYGQYLTDTLMEMDAGPEVFYYLANNIDEAEDIVNAGPRKATIALAKLEVQLAGTKTPKTPVAKVTNAPKPPPQVKGSAVAKGPVKLDTDDLDAFSRELFKKK